MNQAHAILLPVAVLAIWTLLVLLLIPYQRFRAALAGELTVKDFRVGESERVSERVRMPNRNYMNLLEGPILFYVACLAAIAVDVFSDLLVTLCWAYVALRITHSLVHLSYNHVIHRLTLFAGSNLVLTAIWILIFIALIQGTSV